MILKSCQAFLHTLFVEVGCELGCSPALPGGTGLRANAPGPALSGNGLFPLFSEPPCLLRTTGRLPGGRGARAIWETHLLLCEAAGDSPGAEVVALVTHLSPQ